MGVGNLCYKSGGSLAYSKGGSGSLIYRGTWRWTVSWSGSYSTRFNNSPRSKDYTSAQSAAEDFIYPNSSYPSVISWSTGPLWIRWDRSPSYSIFASYTSEPTTKDGYVNYYDWHLSSDYIVIFNIGDYSSYGGGYGVRAFGSSSPTGAFTQIADYASAINDISDVEITTGWV
jgi:hypothetical protein